MTRKREDVTLYGGEAKKFREIRQQLADRLGYEDPEDVSRPRVFDHMLEFYDGPLLDEEGR